MHTKRIATLQDSMAHDAVDLAVLGCGSAYQYFTGTDNGWRFRADMVSATDLLLVGGDAQLDRPLLLAAGDPLLDRLREEAARRSIRTIAVGDRPKPSAWVELIRAFPDATFVSGDSLVAPLRMIKDDGEIETLRRAAYLTDEAVKASLPMIREGVTMRELQLEIETQARRRGAVGTSFDIVAGFIQAGSAATGRIFGYEPDEGLRNGTTIFFDVGFVVDGYCSDWGRTVYFGTPDENHRRAYAALQRAVTETIARIKPGRTRVCDLYPMMETSLDRDGYGDHLRARLPPQSVGHQIGIEVHELPWLEPKNSDTIVPGMVFCVEPKLWDDGTYYMRVEDMVLATENGAEALTTFDRELFAL